MESKSEKDERLGRLLKGAQQALRNKMDAVLAVSGLTTPQYAALSALERTSQISNADLAKGCFVTAQTMIRIVKNLEDEGLIRKIDHPTHGKIITIELTAKGQKILRTAHQQVNEIERSLLKGFSRQELISMTTCLKRMIKNINSNL
jgi:DNA-binding MarR family transcriptional regulator